MKINGSGCCCSEPACLLQRSNLTEDHICALWPNSPALRQSEQRDRETEGVCQCYAFLQVECDACHPWLSTGNKEWKQLTSIRVDILTWYLKRWKQQNSENFSSFVMLFPFPWKSANKSLCLASFEKQNKINVTTVFTFHPTKYTHLWSSV